MNTTKRASTYKERAIDILKEFETLREESENDLEDIVAFINNGEKPYHKLEKVFIKFSLLVYNFDSNLPLNKLIERVLEYKFEKPYNRPTATATNLKNLNDFRYLVDLFIDYLDEFFLKIE